MKIYNSIRRKEEFVLSMKESQYLRLWSYGLQTIFI